jgi:hypothetical protein
MKNIVIRIIISIVVILVISACSKDEEEETITAAEHFGCKGSSSGSGPTIGGVTLKEATYKLGTKSFAFVNSTSANHVYTFGTTPLCYTIDVSSTTASMLKTNSANTGNATYGGVSLSGYDNVTAYYMTMKTGAWDSSPTTYHMYIYADTDSTFYINYWGFPTKAQADAYFYMKDSAYTKQ